MLREKILLISGRSAVCLIMAVMALVITTIWISPSAWATRVITSLLETLGTSLLAVVMVYLYTREVIASESDRTLGILASLSYNVTVVSILVTAIVPMPLFWNVTVDGVLVSRILGTSCSLLLGSLAVGRLVGISPRAKRLKSLRF